MSSPINPAVKANLERVIADEQRTADFTNLTAVGVVREKIGYSAPEQLLGQAYDARADLFALGATAHETLTGKRMFKGDSEVTLLMDCLHSPLRPPSVDRPEIPVGIDRVVMGLLDREVKQRTPSQANERK